MSGLDYGKTLKIKQALRHCAKKEEGVHFNELTNKWIVNIKNETTSKHQRPIVGFAQFDTEEEANDCYQKRIS